MRLLAALLLFGCGEAAGIQQDGALADTAAVPIRGPHGLPPSDLGTISRDAQLVPCQPELPPCSPSDPLIVCSGPDLYELRDRCNRVCVACTDGRQGCTFAWAGVTFVCAGYCTGFCP